MRGRKDPQKVSLWKKKASLQSSEREKRGSRSKLGFKKKITKKGRDTRLGGGNLPHWEALVKRTGSSAIKTGKSQKKKKPTETPLLSGQSSGPKRGKKKTRQGRFMCSNVGHEKISVLKEGQISKKRKESGFPKRTSQALEFQLEGEGRRTSAGRERGKQGRRSSQNQGRQKNTPERRSNP